MQEGPEEVIADDFIGFIERQAAKEARAARRLDSRLESAGAEHLVVAHLLIEGIQAFKAELNYPGYDVVATNPEKNRACRIQVKSRWATDHGGFLVDAFDCDFFAFVALNRGYRKAREGDTGRRLPDIYIVPAATVRAAYPAGGKVTLKKVPDAQDCRDNWAGVRNLLEL